MNDACRETWNNSNFYVLHIENLILRGIHISLKFVLSNRFSISLFFGMLHFISYTNPHFQTVQCIWCLFVYFFVCVKWFMNISYFHFVFFFVLLGKFINCDIRFKFRQNLFSFFSNFCVCGIFKNIFSTHFRLPGESFHKNQQTNRFQCAHIWWFKSLLFMFQEEKQQQQIVVNYFW